MVEPRENGSYKNGSYKMDFIKRLLYMTISITMAKEYDQVSVVPNKY